MNSFNCFRFPNWSQFPEKSGADAEEGSTWEQSTELAF